MKGWPRRRRKAERKLAQHVMDHQILPQVWAQQFKDAGLGDMEISFVRSDPNAEGFTIKCTLCGREARSTTEPPEGKSPICPQCMRALIRGENP